MTEFASAAFLIELDVFEMTEVTGLLAHLELLFIAFVLVTGGAIELLAFDLFLFIQMGFMDEFDFFGELNFFGFEFIVRFTVTGSGHAAGVGNFRSGLDRFTAKGQV